MHPRHKQISELILNKQYDLAEQLAKELITDFPIDGQGWLLLGEALMKQNNGQAAQLLFNRALLLDPKAKWMPFMLNELKNISHGQIANDIERLLSVPMVTVSAAIIVKNEERCIERCIRSIEKAVNEIIVVDSGSTDQTLTILKSFAHVKVYSVNWENSFADLRNEALKHVTSDWVFWIDADEWLHEKDVHLIREAAGLFNNMHPIMPALQPCLINHVNTGELMEFSVPRLFQTNKGIYYSGRIHEQIATVEEGIYTTNILHKPIGIRLNHDGYEPSIKVQKDKMNRNLKLLEIMTEEDPTNPGWWYFLGRESMDIGGSQRSLDCFEKVIEYGISNSNFGRMAEVYMLIGKIHISHNRLELAEEFYCKALSIHPDYPDAHFCLASIATLKAQQLLKKAMDHVNLAASGFHTYRGPVASDQEIYQWKADALKSDIFVHNGQLSEGKKLLTTLKNKLPKTDFIDIKLRFIEEQKQQLQLLN